MLKLINKKVLFFFEMLLICLCTVYPFIQKGLAGYFPDLMYHMLRIEGVREALANCAYPTKIYHFFYNGYGYGSPLFYPDVFLVIPAGLRLIGLSPIQSWKLFVAFLTICISVSTYYSFRYISKNHTMAIAGTFLLVLSQFYLADIMNRVGLSEYIAFIFIPILMAGIYDFFVYEGKRVYLMGIAFLGLLFSHSIMTFLGVLVTVIIFVCMLFSTRYRKVFADYVRMRNLALTALLTFLLSAWYLFPMLEQMKCSELNYMYPWAWIGNYVQPFSVFFNTTGYFDSIAYVGIGMPIIILLIMFGKNIIIDKNSVPWSRGFIYGGLLLFLATTKIIPWEKLNGTFLNIIQFTYRFYPYALAMVCIGIMLHFCGLQYDNFRKSIATFIIVISCIFAVLQNNTSYVVESATYQLDEEYVSYNSNYAAAAEWLPVKVSGEIREGIATTNVQSEAGEIEFVNASYGNYSFEISQTEVTEYRVPLIYYKGYGARLLDSNGKRSELNVKMSENGTVIVENTSGKTGTVEVWYKGTRVQMASTILSIMAFIGILLLGIVWKVKEIACRKKEYIS